MRRCPRTSGRSRPRRTGRPSCAVGPPLLPRSAVSNERDPYVGTEPEVMCAVEADVVVRPQLLLLERDATSRTVRRQQDLGQLGALDRDLFAVPLDDRHQRLRPPSTAMTWPVIKPAFSEQRNATVAATSSALASRLIGVILTSSETISSVSHPDVSSVRT